jgi:integrase
MVVTVQQAVGDFMDFMAGRGLAAGTIARQRGSLEGRNGFIQACRKTKGPNPTMGQVDFRCVTEYFKAHQGGNGSRNNKLVVLRKFLGWAEGRRLLRPGLTAAALLDGYDHRKVSRSRKLYVEADRFAEMLDAAEKQHPRDRAVVALILYTLARQSEIKPMRLKDLNLDSRDLRMYRQKTGRHTETGVTPDLETEMNEWLDWYALHTAQASPAQMVADHPDWYLTPARRRGVLRNQLNPERPLVAPERIMQGALMTMGYEDLKGEGCHTGRRSGARAMFRHLRDSIGWDGALIRVQAMLDHEDPQMTLRYIGLDQEKDELNTWLKTNSMYGARSARALMPPDRNAEHSGHGTPAKPKSNVIPLRRLA